ncbi:MAG: hypothetical protein JO264_07720 [Acidisphaera sp.]|nr:hypothetical protein [Acidisphaera sp.]
MTSDGEDRPPPDTTNGIKQEIEAARQQVQETILVSETAQSRLDRARQTRIDEDRSKITRTVFNILSIAIIATFVIIWTEGRSDPADATVQALDVLKSVVLPVVTLVLGFYFGQSSKS